MKTRYLIISLASLAVVFSGDIKPVQAATFSVSTNVGFTVNIWYGSSQGSVSPTWTNQGTWGMPIGGLPDGWYTWNVHTAPAGYHLEGDSISGSGYQSGGNVSWGVTWYPDAPPQPPPPSVSVSVSPTTVNQGENVTVSWSVSGSVTGCWGTGNWSGWSGASLGTSGGSSSTVGGLTESPTTFGVRCEGPSGSDSKEVAVNVQYTLNVLKSGTGSGTVTGNNGINCGNTCSTVYNYGNMVGLDAVPDSGSTFAGWSSPCSGTGGCVFPISSNQNITATFTKKQPTASITCNPTTVNYGSSANVSWSSTNASNCSVSPCPSGQNCSSTSGFISTGSLTSPKTYQLTCVNQGEAPAPSNTVSSSTSPSSSPTLTLTPTLPGNGTITVTANKVSCFTFTKRGGGPTTDRICSASYSGTFQTGRYWINVEQREDYSPYPPSIDPGDDQTLNSGQIIGWNVNWVRKGRINVYSNKKHCFYIIKSIGEITNGSNEKRICDVEYKDDDNNLYQPGTYKIEEDVSELPNNYDYSYTPNTGDPKQSGWQTIDPDRGNDINWTVNWTEQ